MTLAREGLTLEAFLALPEEKPALEYIDGTVRQKVAPRPAHSASASTGSSSPVTSGRLRVRAT